MVCLRKRPCEHYLSQFVHFPFVWISHLSIWRERKKKSHSLFRRFHAFPSVLLLEVNPKRVSTAFLSTVTTNPRKLLLLSMLLSARMTNKVWHGWDLLGFSSGAYILADKIWLNLAAFRQQASSKQKGPQRRKWAMTCLCPNTDLSSPSSVPQLSRAACAYDQRLTCVHSDKVGTRWGVCLIVSDPRVLTKVGEWVLDLLGRNRPSRDAGTIIIISKASIAPSMCWSVLQALHPCYD